MSRPLSFDEFRTALRRGTLPEEELGRYVELDPAATHLAVRLKPHSLRGHVSPGFDADAEVQRYQRMVLAREHRQRAPARRPRLRVVAEGDSWFNLPWIVRPPAIADLLDDDDRLDLSNIARWGDTLRAIVARDEFIDEIAQHRADWFLLSAGGNDLQHALEKGHLLTVFDPAKSPDQCILEVGRQLLRDLAAGTHEILARVSARFPTIRIACHGYDYPRPETGSGKYIGRYMKALGYPDDRRGAVVRHLIDRYNDELASRLNGMTNVHLLNVRDTTQDLPWFDDMHPRRDGFRRLADAFVAMMLPTTP